VIQLLTLGCARNAVCLGQFDDASLEHRASKGVAEGRFQHHGVAYDPRKDKSTDWTTFYSSARRCPRPASHLPQNSLARSFTGFGAASVLPSAPMTPPRIREAGLGRPFMMDPAMPSAAPFKVLR